MVNFCSYYRIKVKLLGKMPSKNLTKPDVTLVMIVKNEERTLPRLLKSIKNHISAAVIHDTGSTDKTIEVIKQELSGVPVTIKTVEWVSFGVNRTNAIKDAGNTGYLLLADADFEYSIKPEVFSNLNKDGYYIPIKESGTAYSLVMLIKAANNWKYVGRTHEYLDYSGMDIGSFTDEEIFISHHHDGGSRSDKFTRDLALLTEDYLEDPENHRTVFYLAQTYECLGDKEKAIEYYNKRSGMGGWAEEVYISMLRSAKFSDDILGLLAAYSYRPTRLEALYEAAIRMRSAPHAIISLLKDKINDPVPDDVLFVSTFIWDFAFKFELAYAYYRVGDAQVAQDLCGQLLEKNIPDAYRNFILTHISTDAYAST